MYTEREAREQTVRAGLRLLESRLIARTWGNLSARISETQFVVTPSGRAYDTLGPEDMVTVNVADAKAAGPGRPSSEKGVHAAAYRLRPGVGAVIHTHQDYATAFSALGLPLSARGSGAETVSLLGPEVPTAAYGLSSTKRLTNAVAKELAEHPASAAVLMRNHGALCVGADYETAFRTAFALEELAREHYVRLCEAFLPKGWTPEEGARLTEHLRVEEESAAGCVLRSDAPFARRWSELGRTLVPCVDDLAMATGYGVPCYKTDAGARAALGRRSAVLVRGEGALVRAEDREEAETLCILLEKGCRIALLGLAGGCRPIPVGPARALIERGIYVKKYSRLKK